MLCVCAASYIWWWSFLPVSSTVLQLRIMKPVASPKHVWKITPQLGQSWTLSRTWTTQHNNRFTNAPKLNLYKALIIYNKKHLKNVAPIHHNEPPHAHSADVASGTVTRRLRIDVHDDIDNDNDNAWQRGLLWPHGIGPMILRQKMHSKKYKQFVHFT